jgi:RNA polymerase sigma-70 factor (ECF subfamily)
VEDVAQEALLRAWRARDRCRDPAARGAWVARICHNEAMRLLSTRSLAVDPCDHPFDACAGFADETVTRLDVRAALDRLPDGDRRLLLLRYGLDLTQPAAARVADIPEGTAKVRLHRLRNALRDQLEDHG